MPQPGEKVILLEETAFNINHQVKVRLTDRGLEALIQRVQEVHEVSRHEAAATIRVCYKRDDVFVFQLYELMSLLGPLLPSWATSDPRYMLFEQNQVILMPDL